MVPVHYSSTNKKFKIKFQVSGPMTYLNCQEKFPQDNDDIKMLMTPES
jgi:hypothetical protein